MEIWKPSEIIVHESVKDDPATIYFLGRCPGVRVKYVSSGNPKEIVKASEVLCQAKGRMLDKILLGKRVVYISPATDVLAVC